MFYKFVSKITNKLVKQLLSMTVFEQTNGEMAFVANTCAKKVNLSLLKKAGTFAAILWRKRASVLNGTILTKTYLLSKIA